jgi:hypothetical protein
MFGRSCRKVKQHESSKPSALLRYAGVSFLPLVVFLALFFAVVGWEELTGTAWISELLGRSLIPVLAIAAGLALVANLAFVVTLAIMKTGPKR